MAIYDILRSSPTGGQLDWTVPGAGISSTFNSGVVVGVPFQNVAANQYFAPGDSIVIQKIWTRVPFGFGQANLASSFQFKWDNGSNTYAITVPELSNGQGTYLPNFCDPIEQADINAFFLAQPSLTAGRRLGITAFQVDISLVNMPAVLVGQLIRLEMMLLVRHTLPMQNTP